MEILFDRRTVKELRTSAADAIEDGDYDALGEDIVRAFSDEQIEEIEKRLSSGDFSEFISEILDEWGMDNIDNLFELLESHFAEIDIELRIEDARSEDDEEEEDFDEDDIDESLDENESLDEDDEDDEK